MLRVVAADHNYRKSPQTDNIDEQPTDEATEGAADAERIIDMMRLSETSDMKCLVKFKQHEKPKWVLADKIKRTHPLLVIEYYETRIILRKRTHEMAFERNAPPNARKLVIINWIPYSMTINLTYLIKCSTLLYFYSWCIPFVGKLDMHELFINPTNSLNKI